jgi:RND family efflux transporter MFP subunit
MNDKSHLLQQLRIERDMPLETTKGVVVSRRWWIAIAVALIGSAGWLVASRSVAVPIPVRVSVAKVSASDVGAAGNGMSILDASGYVVARRQATVSAKVTGKLAQLFIEEGQHVKAGDVLAKLDDTNSMAELKRAQATLAQAEVMVAQSKVLVGDLAPTYQRNQKQAAEQLISNEALETSKASYDSQQKDLAVAEANLKILHAELEVAQRNEDDTIVLAPYTGVITSKNAQEGEIISPLSAGGGFTRTGIGTLVDMDSLEVETDVNENFIGRIHPNEPAILKVNAYPDWQIPAYVIAVIPTADRSKATVKVRIGFKTHDARILPEMSAHVSFLNESNETTPASKPSPAASGVIVQPDAVQQTATAGTGVVFVLLENGTVERRTVNVGAKTSEGITISSGLSKGERVVVGDLGKLKDGNRVSVVPD